MKKIFCLWKIRLLILLKFPLFYLFLIINTKHILTDLKYFCTFNLEKINEL